MIPNLDKKDADIEEIAKKAMRDGKLISKLIENLRIKNEIIRYNSHKILVVITEEKPKLVYPYWDVLENMLEGKSTYWRSSAAHLIANLTPVDSKNKFEKIFDKYYDMLNDSIIIAANLTAYSGKIAKAKPNLQEKITNKLLDIDKTEQKHKDLMKAGAIQSFDEYYNDIKDKKRILKFVKETLSGDSAKTKKIAKEFLEKWDKNY